MFRSTAFVSLRHALSVSASRLAPMLLMLVVLLLCASIGRCNDAPTAIDDTASASEDTPATIYVTNNDTDPENDPLMITAVTQPGTGTGSTAIDMNAVVYTPPANWSGTATFSYTITDMNGNYDSADVTITVSPVNDPPDAVDDTATCDEDDDVTVAVLNNDTDIDGDDLYVDWAGNSMNGTVTYSATSVTYTPNENYYGFDCVMYSISDGNGGSDYAYIMISITPTPDSPIAVDDARQIDEDYTAWITVTANDSDPDGDFLTVEWVGTPSHGTAEIYENSVIYHPTSNWSGTDQVQYRINDGTGRTATATVTITVLPVNDDPVAVEDQATTTLNVPVTINVLTNDTDPENDQLTVTGVEYLSDCGTATYTGTSVTYTPLPDWVGLHVIFYTVSDGNGGTATGTINVNVVGANVQMQDLPEETSTPPNEEEPGGFLWVNRDFDNHGTTPDKDIVGAIPDEDDLVPITLSVVTAVQEGTVTLTVVDKAKVWTTATRTALAPTTWNLATETVPATLYLEGVSKSSAAGDLEITLAYDNGQGVTTSDLAKVTVVDADLDIVGIDETLEESPGGAVGLNKPPLPITPGIPAGLAVGAVSLTVTAGADHVALWADAEMTTPLPTYWDLTQPGVAVPDTVYVQGILVSDALRDVELTLSYTSGGHGATDTIKLTVIKVDLIVQELDEETGATPHEEDPGAFLVLNKDDDDANGTPDKDDTATVTGEDDLVEATLVIEPAGLDFGTVQISGLAAWLSDDKATAVPDAWDLSTDTLPATVYLEGTQASSSLHDQAAMLSYNLEDQPPIEDTVLVTVVDANLAVAQLDETDEETVGAFVGVNNDDDNGNSVADMSETADPGTGKTLVNAENELLPVAIEYPVGLETGTLTLTGGENIKVWTAGNKDTEITLPVTWDLSTDTPPAAVYVEGIEASTDLRDTSLTLSLACGAITMTDTIDVTVVQVDVSLANAVLLLNDDDDNSNATADKDDAGPVAGEDDLVAATLTVTPDTLDVGTLALSLGGLKAWTTATKTAAATTSWTLSPTATFGDPVTIYLEGATASRAVGDQPLTFEFKQGSKAVHADTASATVAALAITMGNTALQINSDDDNANSISDLLDAGAGPLEDDLVSLGIQLTPSGVSGTLAVTAGAPGCVALWAAKDKSSAPPAGNSWSLPIDPCPDALWVEGTAITDPEEEQPITVTFSNGASQVQRTVACTVNARQGGDDSEACFRLFATDTANPTIASLVDELDQTIGGLVAVVLEVKVGAGDRILRDESNNLLADTLTVRINDDWTGYEAGKSRALKDIDIALSDTAKWSELTNPTDDPEDWNWQSGNVPTISNQSGGWRKVYRAVVTAWDTPTEPGVKFNIGTPESPIWQDFTPSMGHNGNHTISVAAIDGDPEATHIPFEHYDNDWQEPYDGGPESITPEAKNLVVTSITANYGNINYFKYEPYPDSPYNQPQFSFTFEDKNNPGQNHSYYCWVMIQPTKFSGKEFHDLVDLYGYAYAYVQDCATPIYKSLTWDGSIIDPDKRDIVNRTYELSGPGAAEWGTYTYDVIIVECASSIYDPNSIVDCFAYKWPYCLTIGDHNIWRNISENGTNDIRCNYEVVDYNGESQETIHMTPIDGNLDEISTGIDGSGEIGVHNGINNEGNVISSLTTPADFLRIIYTGKDKCWVEYRRDHQPSLMLAVNMAVPEGGYLQNLPFVQGINYETNQVSIVVPGHRGWYYILGFTVLPSKEGGWCLSSDGSWDYAFWLGESGNVYPFDVVKYRSIPGSYDVANYWAAKDNTLKLLQDQYANSMNFGSRVLAYIALFGHGFVGQFLPQTYIDSIIEPIAKGPDNHYYMYDPRNNDGKSFIVVVDCNGAPVPYQNFANTLENGPYGHGRIAAQFADVFFCIQMSKGVAIRTVEFEVNPSLSKATYARILGEQEYICEKSLIKSEEIGISIREYVHKQADYLIATKTNKEFYSLRFVEAIQTTDKNIYWGKNKWFQGYDILNNPEIDPRLQQLLMGLRNGKGHEFCGKCGFCEAVNEALKSGKNIDDLAGAEFYGVQMSIRKGQRGYLPNAKPCDSCKELMDILHIKY